MNTTWNEYWNSLQVGESVTEGNMQVFSLHHKMRPSLDYLTLERALKEEGGKGVSVEEVSSAGSVTELKVLNRLKSPVLLLEGEILMGAKQTRTVHTTILVDRKSTIIIPVACVESGRYQSASEVVRAALRLLEDEEVHRQAELVRARDLVREGADQLDSGKVVDADEVFRRLDEKHGI